MLMYPIYEVLSKIVCCKLVMKHEERRKVEKTMGCMVVEQSGEGSNTTKESGIYNDVQKLIRGKQG